MTDGYRIAMVETGGWGGIGHYAYNLSAALGARGCHVDLITGGPYELSGLPRPFTLHEVLRADAGYVPNLVAIGREIRRRRPHVVHIQSTLSARRDWLPILGLRVWGVPVVLTVHNVLPHDRAEREARFMRQAYTLIYRTVDHLIVHGHDSRRRLKNEFGAPPSRCSVIPHGDYTFADPGDLPSEGEARRRLGLPETGRVLLCFGALREYKGIPDLVQAFAASEAARLGGHLAIVGKPAGLRPEVLARLIDSLGISSQATLRPEYVPFSDIGLYFRASDVVVLPYRALTQSGALQLAYAFSRPVIVTRVGELPQTVEDGRNGYIVPPASPDALARAISRVLSLEDRELARMGTRSRELAGTCYAWSDIADRTLRVYARATGVGRRPATEAA